ncbi:bursicon, partial [Aedes aegypti]|uniref:DAN domain-containing protein n=1 Tax=Aedes aegypti TaxID=7159 RepID=A0A6R5ILE7_AEDAE
FAYDLRSIPSRFYPFSCTATRNKKKITWPPLADDIQHYTADDCQVTPVIHVLQYPGCVPKPIPSFACIGRCASYIQVSGSKIWQMERSCMCCQESGEREASVSLFCPKAKNGEKKFKKVWNPTVVWLRFPLALLSLLSPDS